MATTAELFGDYNYYRLFTRNVAEARAKGRHIQYLKATSDRLKALERMRVWCGEQRIAARHWLCWLFYRGHWVYARPFNQLHPKKKATEKALLVAYSKCGALPMFERRLRGIAHERDVKAEAVYDGNRDLAATTEALKDRYQLFRDSEGCIGDARTKGYHPKSRACQVCSLASRCEQQLQQTAAYDIVALRRGDLTVEQAKREVFTHAR